MIHFFWLILFLLCSCEQKELTKDFTENVTLEGIAMTIPYKLILNQNVTDQEKNLAELVIFQTFEEVNQIYNNWNQNSEISALNQLEARKRVSISQKLAAFLKKTDEIHRLTARRFDPTVAPLVNLWKMHLNKGTVPSQAEIKLLEPAIGWDKIHFDENFFWKDHSLAAMDFGGIAKGFCIDLIIERLAVNGFSNFFFEWGGEIRTLGSHPEKRNWRIAIQTIGLGPSLVIEAESLAIATSGDYYQFWQAEEEEKTEKFFHIIDPFTLKAKKIESGSIGSATVQASSCMLADALATAVMVFSNKKEAEAWIKEIEEKEPGIKFWLQFR